MAHKNKKKARGLYSLIEENQMGSFFRSYYSHEPNDYLEIKAENSMESPFIHALILEELAKLNDSSIQQRVEMGRRALLSSIERHNGFYVWRFAKPYGFFQYSPDFDDTAVAVRSLVATGENSLIEKDLSESYQKLIRECPLWISEKDIALPTFLNRDEHNSIDFVVNAHALHAFLLTKPQDMETGNRLANTLTKFVNSNLFDMPLEKVSKYYLYNSSFAYTISNIQRIKSYFDEKTIGRIKDKLQSSEPKNVLDASLISLSLRNFNERSCPLKNYLEKHVGESDKIYALFRRRRGNLYFGSPLINYLVTSRAMKN